jgi:chromosome partitioning protein
MTVVLAIANQKGGVGKTTTAINLSAAVAAAGKRCLLVDLDPQANATSGLGVSVGESPTVYDVLLDDRPILETVLKTPQAGLDIVPSSADLAGADVELVPAMAREQRLKRALATELPYDLVVVDCPPSLGLLTVNALTAATEVLVPVQCEYMALEGLGQLIRTLEAVRRNLNPDLNLRGVLLTMFDGRTNLAQQVAAEVRNHFPNTFETVIPRNIRVSEAPSHGLPINLYDPSSRAAKAYAAIAAELLRSLDLAPVAARRAK